MPLKKISAGGIVLNEFGEIALVKERGKTWSFPKGKVEPGEDVYSAARREIHEQAGIQKKNLHFDQPLGAISRYKGGKPESGAYKKIYMFLFHASKQPLIPIDPLNPEARWMKPNDALSMLTHKEDKQFLSRMLPIIDRKVR